SLVDISQKLEPKLKDFGAFSEANELKQAIDKANETIKKLEDKLKAQTLEQEKEALKEFADRFKQQVDTLITETNAADSLDELKKALEEIESLATPGKENSKRANELNLTGIKKSIDESLAKLEAQKNKLDGKKQVKELEAQQLATEVESLIKEIKEVIQLANKANSLSELTLAKAKLDEVLAKAVELDKKL
ncbi:hypothetical protein OF363_02925, partial [Mycoplasma enhydrae]|uniref:hypothetical protein n=1 Tax=Mycoplasma enhydrae TaxID=2499220 RepID=UPI0021E7E77D